MEDVFFKNMILVIGAIFSAIVAGFFAFINLISSKEQKVSEFRQKWIDSLRESISAYISYLSYLSILYKHHNDEHSETKRSKLEMAESVNEIYVKVNESYNDILFRVNPIEKEKQATEINAAFLASLSKTRELHGKGEFLDAIESCKDLREKSIPLLKYEWVRVKDGELCFRFWKRFSVGVLMLGMFISIFSGVLIYNNLNFKYKADIQVELPLIENTNEDKPNIQPESPSKELLFEDKGFENKVNTQDKQSVKA